MRTIHSPWPHLIDPLTVCPGDRCPPAANFPSPRHSGNCCLLARLTSIRIHLCPSKGRAVRHRKRCPRACPASSDRACRKRTALQIRDRQKSLEKKGPRRSPPKFHKATPAGVSHTQSWPPRFGFRQAKEHDADACHGWNRILKRLPWQAISDAASASQPPPRERPRQSGSAASSWTASAASKPARRVLVRRQQKHH